MCAEYPRLVLCRPLLPELGFGSLLRDLNMPRQHAATEGGHPKALLIHAPDWTRTSTPSRAQALNLPRIPIPPQGLRTLLYPLG
jgi:hypothetical protein